MEEISPNQEAEVTNERSATFYLYHPCSLLQKFLGTFFKCLGFEIETNKKEHDEVEAHSDAEEYLGSNDDGKVLACAEQKECSTSDGQSFQLISTLIIRRGGQRRSDLSMGRGGRRRSDLSTGKGPGINSEFL